MSHVASGIDVHKKVLTVAVADVTTLGAEFECRRFGSTTSELRPLLLHVTASVICVIRSRSVNLPRPPGVAKMRALDLAKLDSSAVRQNRFGR